MLAGVGRRAVAALAGGAPRRKSGGTHGTRGSRGPGGPCGHAARPSHRGARLRRATFTAAGVVAVFCCALRETRQLGVQSDGAALVLQAQAMDRGNLLLHGWYLSDVSFYTTELPEYMLVELVRGARPDVVQLCAALTYTLLVVLAAAVARGRANGRAGLARATITVAIMLGPTVAGAAVVLNDPDHTGTAVPVLLAALLLDRAGRRWWVPAVAAVVLGWAFAGDQLVLLIGVVPLVAVGGARALRLLALRRPPPSTVWFDLSLAGAGVAAAAMGLGLIRVIAASGGFVVAPSKTQYVEAARALPGNIAGMAADFLDLFSADFFGARLNGWLMVTGVHLVFAGLVAGALVLALRRFFRGVDLVTQLLAAAIAANILAYALLYPVSASTAREIAPVFALGAALAGRVLGDRALAGQVLRDRALASEVLGDRAFGDGVLGDRVLGGGVEGDRAFRGEVLGDRVPGGGVLGDRALGGGVPGGGVPGGRALGDRAFGGGAERRLPAPPLVALLAAGVVAAVAAAIPSLVAVRTTGPADVSLARFLDAHGLLSGIAGYWQADSVVMDSGGRVTVRAVTFTPGVGLTPYLWEADAARLDPRTNSADFLVANKPDGHPSGTVTEREAVAQFGPPAATYRYQGYTIMLWRKNLLAQLGSARAPR